MTMTATAVDIRPAMLTGRHFTTARLPYTTPLRHRGMHRYQWRRKRQRRPIPSSNGPIAAVFWSPGWRRRGLLRGGHGWPDVDDLVVAALLARSIARTNITRGTVAFTIARPRSGLLASGRSAAASAQEGHRGQWAPPKTSATPSTRSSSLIRSLTTRTFMS